MNKYRVTTFADGEAQSYVVYCYDIISAIGTAVVEPKNVIKIELIGAKE